MSQVFKEPLDPGTVAVFSDDHQTYQYIRLDIKTSSVRWAVFDDNAYHGGSLQVYTWEEVQNKFPHLQEILAA